LTYVANQKSKCLQSNAELLHQFHSPGIILDRVAVKVCGLLLDP